MSISTRLFWLTTTARIEAARSCGNWRQYDPRVRPLFREPPNGVGRAIAEGLKAATGRCVLLMDCDFLHILPELRDMFDAAATGADVVLGSRFSRSSVLINYPLQKILCNRSFHLLLSLLFLRKMRDVTNNLKLMRKEVVDNLDLERPGSPPMRRPG